MTSLIRSGSFLEQQDDASAVWAGAVATLAAQGFGMVNYLTSDAAFTDVRLLTTAPALYAGAEAADDPFLHYCCHSYEPTLTGAAFMDGYDYLNDDARQFIRRAASLGFTAGIAVPMRLHGSQRFGGFNMLTTLDAEAFRARFLERTEELRLFCLLIHRRLEELGLDEPDPAPEFRDLLVAPANDALEQLSPREREVIFLIAKGMSRKACAQLCNISQHTVAEYIKTAYRKLGVNNRVEAARLVIGTTPSVKPLRRG